MVENLFKPFELCEITMDRDHRSIVTPPVVEKHGKQWILVEGNARALFCAKMGLTKLTAVIVSNIDSPLPSTGRFSIKELLISDKDMRGHERYPDYNELEFRKIEEAIRPVGNALI